MSRGNFLESWYENKTVVSLPAAGYAIPLSDSAASRVSKQSQISTKLEVMSLTVTYYLLNP